VTVWSLMALLSCVEPQPLQRPAPPPEPYPLQYTTYPPAELPPFPEPIVEVDPLAEVDGVDEPEQLKDWPIPYGAVRERLTMDYLAAHIGEDAITGIPALDSRMVPRVIVLHWTGGGYARSAWFTFQPERRPRRPDLKGAKALNLSVHFIVDRDGTIFRIMDETRVGRHTIGLNHLSIGVENVGDGGRWKLTDAQIASNIDLVRYLKTRFPSVTHLIGHYEYRSFEHAGHDYFQEHDSRRRTRKDDPGEDFMAAVRAGTADLSLLGAPDHD
jgi:hypothetical protein